MANWLDNIIGAISPSAKARRLRAKIAGDILGKELEKVKARRYEGAANGRRTAGWTVSSTSANTEIEGARATLVNRSRDLVRNNPYAKRGINLIATNVVGGGIITQVQCTNKKRQEKFKAAWYGWAESPSVDFDGCSDIYGLQNLVMRTVAESGECLVRRRWSKDNKNQVSLQLQLLEGDYLDASQMTGKASNGNTIIQGIEFDDSGRRVAYHLFEEHPGDVRLKSAFKSVRVPAEDVLHIYDVARSGQVRGVPWLSNAILRLRDLDDYEDAQLMRQKIAACFSVFVQDMDVPTDQASTTNDRGSLGERVEPGLVEILPPGKSITFANPPGVSGYQEFLSSHLRAIAVSLGVTYETLAGDYSQVNYSSGRMGWLEFQRNLIDWQNRIMIAQFLKPVFDWFLNACNIKGQDVAGVWPAFTPPRREMIDPTKEIPATVTAIRSGLMTLQEAIKAYGKEPVEQLQEIKDTNDLIDKFGLKLDCDPRNIDDSGALIKEVNDDEEKISSVNNT